MHDDLGDPGRADRCECEGNDLGACGQHLRPAQQVATRKAHVIALVDVALEGHDSVVVERALDGDDGIGSVRDDPAGRDSAAVPSGSAGGSSPAAARKATASDGPASRARTAYPSIAELGKGGRSSAARTGSASTRPTIAGPGTTRSDGSGSARREQQGAGRIGLEERRRSHDQFPVVVVPAVVACRWSSARVVLVVVVACSPVARAAPRTVCSIPDRLS